MYNDFFVKWLRDNGRNFPWRKLGVDTFSILVTEFMLRQARAENVASIWADFLNDFSDPYTIVLTSNHVLEERLHPLGLENQKACALVQASQFIIEQYNGEIPQGKRELIEIPHVGLYSANAIRCFAYNECVEIVDTNILRFISRVFGIPVKPDIRRNPIVWDIANKMLPDEENLARPHNYGLLDFTAAVCKARTPVCTNCFFSVNCIYYSENS